MASGAALLDARIKALRELAGFGGESAPLVATAMKAEQRRQSAAGIGPDGRALELTKDGRVPLTGSAEAVSIKAVGTVVLMRITGHHARHQFGAVWGKIRREIIPNERIPGPMVKAITKVMNKEFDRIVGDE